MVLIIYKMGIACCKEVRVSTNNATRIVADGELSISWIKGVKIGEGMYSKVYVAIDSSTGGMLAVKAISLNRMKETSVRFITQIRKEVNILKQLNHPNILKYYQTDIDFESNEVYILVEYLAGGNLQSYITQFYPLPERVIMRISKDVITALKYLHSQNIIHRDLKSANILISAENRAVKISDFGLSKVVQSKHANIEFAGSPYWMAPEILNNSGYAFPADIWSFGCTLIEMLTGQAPWSAKCKTTEQLVKFLNNNENTLEIPKCSNELKEVISMCLKRTPTDRPTAKELLDYDFFRMKESSAPGMSTTLRSEY